MQVVLSQKSRGIEGRSLLCSAQLRPRSQEHHSGPETVTPLLVTVNLTQVISTPFQEEQNGNVSFQSSPFVRWGIQVSPLQKRRENEGYPQGT